MFENFVSVGYYCGVAAAMSKLGIRSSSGPFDWYISSFEGVLNCLEEDFEDFLKKENIKLDENKIAFWNMKYSFYLGHEIKVSFEKDYDSICRKYAHRINNFQEQIKRKTCFIRAIQNVQELEYILNNLPRINAVIKKSNEANEIVYIVNRNIAKKQSLSYPFFIVSSSYGGSSMEELRTLFDTNMELQDFFIHNFDETKRYKNLLFDLQKQNNRLEYRYDLMDKIDRIDLKKIDIPQKIIIYGAGRVGKNFYHKICGRCKVLFFIDQNPKENSYEEVPVIPYGELFSDYFNIPIIVTACYEYWEIRERLLDQYGELNIMSITDFFERKE